MRPNELLLWLSARREGSWQQFRQAVEELHSGDGQGDDYHENEFPLYQQLRLDLERLAHVEFLRRIAKMVGASHHRRWQLIRCQVASVASCVEHAHQQFTNGSIALLELSMVKY